MAPATSLHARKPTTGQPGRRFSRAGVCERVGCDVPAVGRARAGQGDGRDAYPRLPRLIGLSFDTQSSPPVQARPAGFSFARPNAATTSHWTSASRFCHEDLFMSDSAMPTGCAGGLAGARRVSSGNVARRAAPGPQDSFSALAFDSIQRDLPSEGCEDRDGLRLIPPVGRRYPDEGMHESREASLPPASPQDSFPWRPVLLSPNSKTRTDDAAARRRGAIGRQFFGGLQPAASASVVEQNQRFPESIFIFPYQRSPGRW